MSDVMLFTFVDAQNWAITPVVFGAFIALVLSISDAALSKRGAFDK